MLLAVARRRVARLRRPRSAARIARALWIVWAVIVWNVVFDRIIVVAGRQYVVAARRAAADPAGRFANMDDWMRPAVTRGFWIATAAGVTVLVTGLAAVRQLERRSARSAVPRLPPSTAGRFGDASPVLQDKPR